VTPGVIQNMVEMVSVGTAEGLKSGTSKIDEIKAQIVAMTLAAHEGKPFCEKCEQARKELEAMQ